MFFNYCLYTCNTDKSSNIDDDLLGEAFLYIGTGTFLYI